MSRHSLAAVLISLFVVGLATSAQAALFTSVQDGSWQDGATWDQGGATPTSADDVIIDHQVTTDANIAITSIIINSTGRLALAAYTLSVTGDMTLNSGGITGTGLITFSGVNKQLFGTGIIANPLNFTTARVINSAANLTLGGTILITGAITIANDGTVTSTNTGANAINGTVAGSTWQNNATGTLNIAASSILGTGTLTATAVGNTVNYNGGAQTVRVNTYHHLGLGGSGIKTFGVTTVNGNLTISGSATSVTPSAGLTVGGALNIGSGTTLSMGAVALTVNGATTVDGTFTITSATGAKALNGDVTIGPAGTWNNNTANCPVTIGGSLVNNTVTGAFNAGTGLYTFSGTAKTISSVPALAIPSVTVSGTYTNTATLTCATALSVTLGTSSLTNNGTISCGTFTLTAAGGLVTNLEGRTFTSTGTPTITGVFNNHGTASFSGTPAIAGTFNNYGTATFSATAASSGAGTIINYENSTLNIANTTLTQSLNVSAAGNTVNYNGLVAQTIYTGTYHHLIINKSGFTGTMNGPVTVNGNLTVTAGTLADNGNQIAGTGSGTITVANGAFLTLGAGVATVFPTTFGTISLGPTSTVTYNSTNPQNISPIPTYGHLTLTGASTKTALGHLTVNGNLTMSTASWGLADGGFTITVKGNVANTGTHIGTGKILLRDGSAAHSITGTGTLSNLELDDPLGANMTAAFTINNNLTITSGIFSTGGNAITVNGLTTTVGGATPGTLRIDGTGAKAFPGGIVNNGTFTVTVAPTSITISDLTSSGTWTNNTVNAPVTITSNLNVTGGTWTPGTGVYTMSGTGKTIQGTLAIPNLTISAGTVTNLGILTSTGTISLSAAASRLVNNGTVTAAAITGGAAGSTFENVGTLNISGALLATGTLIANAAGNTVNYTGTAVQTAKLPSPAVYHHLQVNSTSTVTMGGAVTVNGDLTVNSGTLADGAFQITGTSSGTLSVANLATLQIGAGTATVTAFPTTFGTITLGPTSTVNYNWITTATGLISHVPTYGNLTVTGAIVKTASGNIMVNGNLTMATASGPLADGGFTITVKGNITNNGGHSGSGKILLSGGSAVHSLTGTASYGNLELDDPQGANMGAAFTISGNLTITNGKFAPLANAITVTGLTTIASGGTPGALLEMNGAGAKAFNGGIVNNGTVSLVTTLPTSVSILDLTSSGTWSNTINAPVTISGNLSVSGGWTPGTGTYTLSGAAKTITGAFTIPNLTVSGTYTNNGTLWVSSTPTVSGTLTNNATLNLASSAVVAGTGTIVNAGTGTLRLMSASVTPTLTATAVGNTVVYNGTAAQTAKPTTYHHLTINPSAGVTVTAGGAVTVNGDLTISTGTFNTGATAGWNLVVSGATSISGTLAYGTASTGHAVNDVTVNVGGTWNNAINSAMTVNGNLSNLGTFTPGTGTYTLQGVGKTVSGTYPTTFTAITVPTGASYTSTATMNVATLTVNGTGTFTNNGTLTVTTSLTGTGAFYNGADRTLYLSGNTNNIATFDASADNNTVVFNGGVQTARGGNYVNLTASATTSVTLLSAVTVSGDLTVTSGTLADGGFQISGAVFDGGATSINSGRVPDGIDAGGTLTVNSGTTLQLGSATAATTFPPEFTTVDLKTGSTVNYASGVAQTVAGRAYSNLTLSGASLKTANGDVTVNGTLNIAAGTFNDGGFTITALGTVTNTGAHASTGSGKLLFAGTAATRTISGTGSLGNVEIDAVNGVTTGAAFTMANLTVTSGTFTMAGFATTVSGTTTTAGTGILAITSTTGAKALGNVVNNGTINIPVAATITITDLTSGGVWNNTGNAGPTISGNLNVTGGTWTPGTGVYTLSGTTKTISGAAGVSIPNVAVTGTYTNNTTLTISSTLSGTGTLTQGTGQTLNLGGTATITTLNATANVPNTVNYNGGVQTVGNYNYNNLTLSGTGAKTLQTGTTSITGNLTLSGTASTTTVAGLTVGGNLDIGTGTTFTVGAFAITVTGTTTTTGTGSIVINSATGTKTFTGDVTISATGTWNNSGNSAVSFGGNLTNAGTFTAGTGTYTFTGVGKTITGVAAIPSVTVTAPGTLTTTGTFTIATALAGTGTLINGTGQTLNLGGTATITTLDATASPNTVVYNGTAAQTARGTTYHHLTINPSAGVTVTLGAAATVNGNLTVSQGTFSDGGFQITGGVYDAGTLTVASGATLSLGAGTATTFPTNFTDVILTGSTVNYASTAAQTVAGREYHNLTLSGASTKTADGNVTVNGTLNIAAGTFNDGGFTITARGTVTNTGAHASTGSGKLLFWGSAAGRTVSGTGSLGNVELDDANGVTTGAAFTMANLTVTSGTFTMAGFATTVSGTTTTTGTGILLINNATGAKALGNVVNNGTTNITVAATITITDLTSGGVWNNTGNAGPTISGNLNVTGGTWTPGTGTYTLSGAAKTITGAFTIPNLTVSGTYTNNGTLWVSSTPTVSGTLTNNATLNFASGAVVAGAGTIVNAATGTLNLMSASVTPTLTATAAGNTVVYNGTAAQTAKPTTYHHLTINPSAGVTVTAGGAVTVNGDLTIAAGGTFNTGATTGYILTANGPTSISGTLTFGLSTTHALNDVTVNAGGTWNNAVNSPIVINGNLAFNGATFTPGTGTYTLQGAGKTVSGTYPTAFTAVTVPTVGTYTGTATWTVGTFTVNGAGVFTNDGALTVTASLTGNGTLVNAAGRTLTLNGATNNITTLTATASPNTVVYSGTAAQTAKGTTYHHLTINNAAGVTLGAAATINGDLTVTAGTFSDGGFQITGGVYDAGTLTVASGAGLTLGSGAAATTFPTNFTTVVLTGSTVTYASTAAQTVAGRVYHNLTLSGASTKTADGNVTVNGTLNIAAGTFNDGGFTITALGTVTNTGAHASTGSGKLLFAGTAAMRTISGTGSLGNVEIDAVNGVTTGAAFTMANLTVTSGTFTMAGFATTVSGTTTTAGTGILAITSTTGTKALGNVVNNGTINIPVAATITITDLTSGGVWNNSGSAGPTISGNLNVTGGTWTPGTGTYTLSGTGRTISGAAGVSIPNVAVSGTYTNNTTLTISTALSGAGGLTQGTGQTLNLGGTATITTLTATASPNTVVYNGTAAQTIKGTTYHHLTVNNAAGATLGAATTVNGTLDIASGTTLALSTLTLTVNADLTLVNGATISQNGAGGNMTVNAGYTNHGLHSVTNTGTLTVSGLFTNSSTGVITRGALSTGLWTLNGGFTNSGTYTASTVASPLTLGASSPFVNSSTGRFTNTGGGTLTFNNTLTNNGDFYHVASAAMSVAGAVANTDSFFVQSGAGTMTFSSTFANSGVFSYNSTGALTVTGLATNTSTGTINRTAASGFTFSGGLANAGTYLNATTGALTVGTAATGGAFTLAATGDFQSTSTGAITFLGDFINDQADTTKARFGTPAVNVSFGAGAGSSYSPQRIRGSAATTFNLMTVNKDAGANIVEVDTVLRIRRDDAAALTITRGTLLIEGGELEVTGHGTGTAAAITGTSGADGRLVVGSVFDGPGTLRVFNLNQSAGLLDTVIVRSGTAVISGTHTVYTHSTAGSHSTFRLEGGLVQYTGTTGTGLTNLSFTAGSTLAPVGGWSATGGVAEFNGNITAANYQAYFKASGSAQVKFVGSVASTVTLMTSATAYPHVWEFNDLIIDKVGTPPPAVTFTGGTAAMTPAVVLTNAGKPFILGGGTNPGQTLHLLGAFASGTGYVFNAPVTVDLNSTLSRTSGTNNLITINGKFTLHGTYTIATTTAGLTVNGDFENNSTFNNATASPITVTGTFTNNSGRTFTNTMAAAVTFGPGNNFGTFRNVTTGTVTFNGNFYNDAAATFDNSGNGNLFFNANFDNRQAGAIWSTPTGATNTVSFGNGNAAAGTVFDASGTLTINCNVAVNKNAIGTAVTLLSNLNLTQPSRTLTITAGTLRTSGKQLDVWQTGSSVTGGPNGKLEICAADGGADLADNGTDATYVRVLNLNQGAGALKEVEVKAGTLDIDGTHTFCYSSAFNKFTLSGGTVNYNNTAAASATCALYLTSNTAMLVPPEQSGWFATGGTVNFYGSIFAAHQTAGFGSYLRAVSPAVVRFIEGTAASISTANTVIPTGAYWFIDDLRVQKTTSTLTITSAVSQTNTWFNVGTVTVNPTATLNLAGSFTAGYGYQFDNIVNNGALVMQTGTNNDLYVSGNWSGTGTFTHQSKTVTFNGTGDRTLALTGSLFNVISAKGTGSLSLAGDVQIERLLQVQSGTFNVGQNILTMGTAADSGTISVATGATFTAVGADDAADLIGTDGDAAGLGTDAVAKVAAFTGLRPFGLLVNNGATIAASKAVFENPGRGGGVYVYPAATIAAAPNNFSNCRFEHGSLSGPMLRIENTQNLALDNIIFNGTAGFNIQKSTATGGTINVLGGSGTRWGSAFELDPENLINWTLSLDVACFHVSAPVGFVDSGATVVPACSVANYGLTPASFEVRMNIGPDPSGLRISNVENLGVGERRRVEFAPWTANVAPGYCRPVRCSTRLDGDQDQTNNRQYFHNGIYIIKRDVRAATFVVPTGPYSPDEEIQPEAVWVNEGNVPGGAVFNATMKITDPDGIVVYDHTVENVSAGSGTPVQIQFADKLTLNKVGLWKARMGTVYSGDMRPENNELETDFIVTTSDVAAYELHIPVPGGEYALGNKVTPSATWYNYSNTAVEFEAWMLIRGPLGEEYKEFRPSGVVLPGQPVTVSDFPEFTFTSTGTWAVRCSTYFEDDLVPEDDTIDREVTVVGQDVGVVSVTVPTPGGAYLPGQSLVPEAKWMNYNPTEPVDFWAWMFITDPNRTQDADWYADSIQVLGLEAGKDTSLKFTTTQILADRGTYEVRCSTYYAEDANRRNDTLYTWFAVGSPDMGVTGILAPLDTQEIRTTVMPSAKVINNGDCVVSVEAWYTMWDPSLDGQVYNEKLTIRGVTIAKETTLVFPAFELSTVTGKWVTRCSVFVAGDQNPDDNVQRGSFYVKRPAPSPWPEGWTEPQTRAMPGGPEDKAVKAGGWLTTGPDKDKFGEEPIIYAGKGNKTREFFKYYPMSDSWVMLRTTFPEMEDGRKKLPSKGTRGVGVDRDRAIYLTRGNNTAGFWRYDIDADTWIRKANVPVRPGYKNVKGGEDLVYVPRGDTDWVYLMKGTLTEFYRYNVNAERWDTLPDIPNTGTPHKKYPAGSFLVYDNSRYIYAHRAKFNDGTNHYMFRYDIAGDSWDKVTYTGMPLFHQEDGKDKKKKVGDGAAGAWFENKMFATKAGGTQGFFRYDPAEDKWAVLDTYPRYGVTNKKKTPKAGSDLVYWAKRTFYTLKGNKTLEMWRYVEPVTFGKPAAEVPGGQMGGSDAVSVTGRMSISPNPLVTGVATLRLSVSQTGPVAVKVYDALGRAVLTHEAMAGRMGLVLPLDLRKLSSGVYLVHLDAVGYSATQKLVVQK